MLKVKCVRKNSHKTPNREHQENTNNTPDNELLGRCSSFLITGRADKAEDTPDNEKNRETEEERNDDVNDSINLLEKSARTACLDV